MDVSVQAPNRISGTDGGIMAPRHPATALVEAANDAGYLSLTMAGMVDPPTAAVVAAQEPQSAP